MDQDHAALLADRFLFELDLSPAKVDQLTDLPVSRLLEAQAVLADRDTVMGRTVFGNFGPVTDGSVVPDLPLRSIARGAAADLPLLTGSEVNGADIYVRGNPQFQGLDRDGLTKVAELSFGAHAGVLVDAYLNDPSRVRRRKP
jgi:para-nitrobenzyl esterase